MHARLDRAIATARKAEVLDGVPQLSRKPNVVDRNRRNALGEYAVGVDRCTESERRQDRELLRGVDPFDIESGIGFGVPSRCASASASANVLPSSSIAVRM